MQYSLDFDPPTFIRYSDSFFFRGPYQSQVRIIGFLHSRPVLGPLRECGFSARRFPARHTRNAGAAPSAPRGVRRAKNPNDILMLQNRARLKSGKIWARFGHICRG